MPPCPGRDGVRRWAGRGPPWRPRLASASHGDGRGRASHGDSRDGVRRDRDPPQLKNHFRVITPEEYGAAVGRDPLCSPLTATGDRWA